MTRKLLMLAGAVAFAGAIAYTAVPAYAHHSFAATYFEDKTDTVEGDLVQFLFRNPHSFVHVEGKDAQGQTVRYAIEWGAGLQLNRHGVNASRYRSAKASAERRAFAAGLIARSVLPFVCTAPEDGE